LKIGFADGCEFDLARRAGEQLEAQSSSSATRRLMADGVKRNRLAALAKPPLSATRTKTSSSDAIAYRVPFSIEMAENSDNARQKEPYHIVRLQPSPSTEDSAIAVRVTFARAPARET